LQKVIDVLRQDKVWFYRAMFRLISEFSVFQVIDPENPFGSSDSVRILLLQFSCLLVEQASPHIHDAANKRQGNKLSAFF
jgi:hypothetical protein